MNITTGYLQERFAHFNTLCFGGVLPPVPLVLSRARTFVGQCSCRRRLNSRGEEEKYDFVIKISTAHDLPEQEVDDTLLHEMIHYYIGVNQLKDTSAHGSLFRQLMNAINTQHNRHITISHRGPRVLDTRMRWHAVAVVRLHDGRTGIKVLPRIIQRIARYYNIMGHSPDVESITLYMVNNPYFNRFPTSSALKVHIIDAHEVAEHLKGAHSMHCDGRSIKVTAKKTE